MEMCNGGRERRASCDAVGQEEVHREAGSRKRASWKKLITDLDSEKLLNPSVDMAWHPPRAHFRILSSCAARPLGYPIPHPVLPLPANKSL
jgi:hypothetical protein